jgi:helix-turn-helix, Psq domain
MNERRLSLSQAAREYEIDRRTLRRKFAIAGYTFPESRGKLYLKQSDIERVLGDCNPKYQYRRLRVAS